MVQWTRPQMRNCAPGNLEILLCAIAHQSSLASLAPRNDIVHKDILPKQKAPAKPGPLIATTLKSARIEFDDQMRLHLHRERHVGQSRDADELRRHLGMIDFEEVGHVALGELACFQNHGELL